MVGVGADVVAVVGGGADVVDSNSALSDLRSFLKEAKTKLQ